MNRSESEVYRKIRVKRLYYSIVRDGPINLKPQHPIIHHAGLAASLARIVPMPRGA